MKAYVKKKLKVAERLATIVVKSGLPYLLEKWRSDFSNITFDEFCENLIKEVNEK